MKPHLGQDDAGTLEKSLKPRRSVRISVPWGPESDDDRNATSGSAAVAGGRSQAQFQDQGRSRLTQPNLHQYVTVPVSDLKPKKGFTESSSAGISGLQRASSQASLAALHVFMTDLAGGKGKTRAAELGEIIPDPSQQPRYVLALKTTVVHLIFAILVLISFILGITNYAYNFLQLSHSRVTIMGMYEPQRGFGGVWEFVGLSLVTCVYSFLIVCYPVPSSWHICELKCKRLTRWIFYFIMVTYLFMVLICWCTEMPTPEPYLHDLVASMNKSSHLGIWNETQAQFLCCGVKGPKDYSGKFPKACCDQRKFSCTESVPLQEEVFPHGCGHTQYLIASTVLGLTFFFGVCIFLITLLMFFRLFVLEVLVLKVERVESSTFQALDMEPESILATDFGT